MNKRLVAYASIGIVFGIALGAFGAHGLRKVTEDPTIINSFKTGVDYHLFHAFAFLVFGLIGSSLLSIPIQKVALRLIFIGTILFSGSLYTLTLLRVMGWKYAWVGSITPVGGSLLILGWAWLAYSLLRAERTN